MKNILKITLIFIVLLSFSIIVNATDISNMSTSELENDIQNETSIDTTNLDIAELSIMYDEITKNYTNQDIANIIEENKDKIIEDTGVDEETLSTATTILRSLDTEETKKILKEDLNIDQMQEKLKNGYTIDEVVKEMEEQLTFQNKISILFKLLLASSIVKTFLIVSGIILVYKIIVRWKIFKKAGRHGWAAIVPVYNEITYLKVSNLSAWWILILIIPVIGWAIYGIIKIISNFTLADAYGKGILFGFGLLIFEIIFESILAFNKNIKYVEYAD